LEVDAFRLDFYGVGAGAEDVALFDAWDFSDGDQFADVFDDVEHQELLGVQRELDAEFAIGAFEVE
jgi:hypothetical protein